MALLYFLLSLGDLGQANAATAASVSPSLPGVKAYTPPFGFPTSAFASYYFLPASPTQEPQPALYDPVLNITYPANLTNPDTIPDHDDDPVFYPEPVAKLSQSEAEEFLLAVVKNVSAFISAGA